MRNLGQTDWIELIANNFELAFVVRNILVLRIGFDSMQMCQE